MNRIRIAVIDDHPVVRDGLSTSITYRAPDIEIIAIAGTGADAIRIAEREKPDVLVLDIKLPDMTGIEVARRLLERDSHLRILMLTSYEQTDFIDEALQLGAHGFLLKDAPPEEIIRAIRSIAHGHMVFSEKITVHIDRRRPPADNNQEYREIAEQLTPRERQILELIAQGYDNHEIGDRLNLSEKTVRNYVSRIYDALDIHARPRLIRWALQNRHFTDL